MINGYQTEYTNGIIKILPAVPFEILTKGNGTLIECDMTHCMKKSNFVIDSLESSSNILEVQKYCTISIINKKESHKSIECETL